MAFVAKSAYGGILSGTLSKYVNDQLSRPAEEQNEIQEELALLRASTATAVQLFNIAVEKDDSEAMLVSGQMMKKELQAVAQMAATAANIQAKSTEQLTRAGVEQIISGIIDIIFAVLRGEENGLELAAQIEKEIASKISLTVDRGTISLPSDEIVRLMDDSIGGDDSLQGEVVSR